MSNYTSTQVHHEKLGKQRLDCLICNHHIDPNDDSAFVMFPCNVRRFWGETFKVWRCPSCRTIHCLDVMNLDDYYAKYPFAEARLTLPFRLYYRNLCGLLKKYGFSKTHSLLDYGCGNGLFIQYLKQQNFTHSYGYDPYASKHGFGDLATLQQAPFDYILLQDVIEHVENPIALLSELNNLLAPGGYILIGTPNATNIDLNCPSLSDYYNPVHVPYHLHIYTRETLESLGYGQGWEPVYFLDRSYNDTPWFSLNTRAWNEYVRHFDGTLNVVFEPIQPRKVLSSYKFLFLAFFGYWLSFHTEMTIIFRKSI